MSPLVRGSCLLAPGAAALLAALLTAADLVRGRVRVRGTSMAPALMPGDDLLTSRLLLRLRGLRRGDIVLLALRPPGAPDRLDLKRVVGLPGERVTVRGGHVLVNGAPLAEPYAEPDEDTSGEQTWELGAGEVFVLGDNRGFSTDSRRYGPISRRAVAGIAWWRTGPGERWGKLLGIGRRP